MRADEIERVAVIGAGTMGHGIALEFALAKYEVSLYDIAAGPLQTGLDRIQTSLGILATAGLIPREDAASARGRIHGGTHLDAVVSSSDVVVEAVVEDLLVKQKLFGELDELCPSRTILASNTSSFMPSQLAVATSRPDRVVVAHYFNPPYLLPAVEVVRSAQTSDETVATLCDFLTRAGKCPVVIQKETPGFVCVRLQAALLREAASIVSQGIASPQDVDALITNSFGRRLAVAGVFEVSDLAGLDLVVAVNAKLWPELERSAEMSPVLQQKVDRAELGAKSGQGFYDWSSQAGEARKKRIAEVLIQLAQGASAAS